MPVAGKLDARASLEYWKPCCQRSPYPLRTYLLVQCQNLCARLASIEWQIGGRIAAGKDRGALVIDHMLYSGVCRRT